MVMHNTKADDAPGCSLPRYFLVILQVNFACLLPGSCRAVGISSKANT